ncbi:uncharacterized protein LOC123565286 [Mercenaria mercenaria]|uniref:uncharacterized protein LOC123565286 n=1 Tax=Mercenaria mercenaria TaxID=6596 RepID=UPI00234E5158|nr:uncharacterized protein LOC123565286 [Mercenaria mercenaria]
MTAFSIQEIVEGKSQSYAMGSRTGISGFRLNFPSQDKIGKLNKTTLVTGTIDGLKDVLTPVLAGETTEKRSLTVTGQVVSVILEPAPTGPFEIQLDISTHDSGVKETSRICAFLQKRSDR